jgi:hypothetical protein
MKISSRSGHLHRAARQLAAALVIIACGLVLTLVKLGLPLAWVHFGGAVLWGAMVLFIVGALLPGAAPTAVWVAAAIALATELFRLYHTPALDAFRLTLPGALLLGRVFNPWNVVAYWVGILAGLPLNRLWYRQTDGGHGPGVP